MVTDAREAFLAFCQLELGLAANTRAAYRRDLALITAGMGELGLTVEGMGPDQLSALLAHLRRVRRLGATSLARLQTTLRMYMRHLTSEGLVTGDRIALVPLPRGWRELPEVLTREEVERIITAVPKGPTELRDRCALELLYASGGRASEVAGLELSDLLEGRTLLRLRGKGSKERLVPIGEAARRSLDRYCAQERPALAGSRQVSQVLLSTRGRPLSRQALWRIVHRAGVLAGLGGRVYTHLLRHSCATHLVEGGADLRSVQEILGHANLSTTQRYTQVDAQRLRAVHARFHPRAHASPGPATPT